VNPIVINVRGTSGSGKSHLVREVMKRYGSPMKYFRDGRKQPIGYRLKPREGFGRDLAVIGHYETDCGGCDTVPKIDEIFELVRKAHADGMDVLFEGLLISAEVNRTAKLHADGIPLVVIALDVPLEECLASVESRRAAKSERTGRPPRGPLNPDNTKSKHRGTLQAAERLNAAGVEVHRLDRDRALALALNRLIEGRRT
jgi:hypothetical protein